MRCPPSCSLVGSSALMDDPPPREGQRPGSFSTYRRFWGDASRWEPLILPPNFDPGPAMNLTRTEPGVYELGVTMPQAPSTVVAVYIGMSANVRRRHLAYVRDGDHIKELVAPMVAEGHTVWQRVRYLVRFPAAQQRPVISVVLPCFCGYIVIQIFIALSNAHWCH